MTVIDTNVPNSNKVIRFDWAIKHILRNIDQAKEKLSVMKMDKTKRQRYERYLMDLAIERDVMETAYREGERKNRFDTARKMRAKGYASSEIADLTGLTVEEIERLD